MKLLDCPGIGARPISEFDYMGEVRVPPENSTEASWGDYVFNRNGAPGILKEWWYHRPTGHWFVLLRDTQTDQITGHVALDEVRHVLPS